MCIRDRLGDHVEDVTSVGGCRVQGREVAADLGVAFLGREPVTTDEDRAEKKQADNFSVYVYSYSRFIHLSINLRQ